MSSAIATTPLGVVWDSGQRAAITHSDGNHVVLQSEIPQAPGTPCAVQDSDGARYEVKVRTCKRAGDPALPFRVEGRLFNLPAPERARLLASLSGEPKAQ
jgi:hypothetical protein